ncbi:hypothetical protein DPEC_G00311410 [Dallia pectoralis]|uniref:Uncharacterized protein n=1 Tax=Dallia pectoralis TaxID=75939 RepID=A0ACC2FBM1_DALPE|nr:hypothetical protein DPEC_G00311410 [Dallia pectoralis]
MITGVFAQHWGFVGTVHRRTRHREEVSLSAGLLGQPGVCCVLLLESSQKIKHDPPVLHLFLPGLQPPPLAPSPSPGLSSSTHARSSVSGLSFVRPSPGLFLLTMRGVPVALSLFSLPPSFLQKLLSPAKLLKDDQWSGFIYPLCSSTAPSAYSIT